MYNKKSNELLGTDINHWSGAARCANGTIPMTRPNDSGDKRLIYCSRIEQDCPGNNFASCIEDANRLNDDKDCTLEAQNCSKAEAYLKCKNYCVLPKGGQYNGTNIQACYPMTGDEFPSNLPDDDLQNYIKYCPRKHWGCPGDTLVNCISIRNKTSADENVMYKCEETCPDAS